MKLISWNVAARVKKQPQQLNAVLEQDPDLLALQEVTSKTARMWKAGLLNTGFDFILSSFDVSEEPEKMVGGRGRALLIASKFPIEPLAQEGLEMPWKERLLSALVHHPSLEFEFHNAYIPPGASHEWLKIDTFEGIYNYLAHGTIIPRILCGDFNSPKQEMSDGRTLLWGQYLAEDGTIQTSDDDGWVLGEKLVICDLAAYGLPDIYRQLNGWDVEDFSWLVYRKGKVVSRRRFDHIFASPGMQAVYCGYLHEFREEGLSDHSAVEAIFSIGKDHEMPQPFPVEKITAEDQRKSKVMKSEPPLDELEQEVYLMNNKRDDIRSRDPLESHRTAFLAGWTRAVQGELFSTVTDKKTHANMGNLLGWVYGERTREFKLAIWYHYLENTDYQED